MTRIIKICFHLILIPPAICLMLFFLLFATLKTSWGQQMATHILNQVFENNGITLRVTGIEGISPLSWHVQRVDYSSSSYLIAVEKITLRIAFLPLLRGHLYLEEVTMNADQSSLSGRLDIQLRQGLIKGAVYGNIHRLSPFFPSQAIDGQLGIECLFSYTGSEQNLDLHLLSKYLQYRDYIADDLSLSAHLTDLHGQLEGQIEWTLEKVYTPQSYFSTIHFETHSTQANWPFTFQMNSPDSPTPDFFATGLWTCKNHLLDIQLLEGKGIFMGELFTLQSPSSLRWGAHQLTLQNFQWNVGAGSAALSATLQPDKSVIDLVMSHFPLKVAQIFNHHFALEGMMTARGHLEARSEALQGSLNIVLEEASLQQSDTHALNAKGSMQIHVNDHRLQVHTQLNAMGGQFLDLSASLPIDYSIYPFKCWINSSQPLSGELTMEGQIQDLFDFINIGTHHLTGFVSARLFLSKTWATPFLQGDMELHQGTYENYYTGTLLQQIEARLSAADHTFWLQQLTASDGLEGLLTAEGSLELNPARSYPYTIQSTLNGVHLLRLDTIDAHLTGPLSITGNRQGALISGTLTVPLAQISIPDRLPYTAPRLPVEFINRPAYLITSSDTIRPTFPLRMDLHLSSTDQIHVSGKGLSSEWMGDLHLMGTNADVAADGSLTLLQGEYLFSGHRFQLTEGSIIFKDKPNPSATLAISGNLSLSDLEVTAHLRGPLTSPQLTFQSNPHMATSAILAKILFNKDLSDISHPEALQLANTLVSLSGGTAPDVLEAIRKSIGVDRLTVVSDPSSDQIALQIGKYLTKGVLITLSQSTTSSQIIVEVELNKNFIFRAETQEEEEGKFSLKWRKNY